MPAPLLVPLAGSLHHVLLRQVLSIHADCASCTFSCCVCCLHTCSLTLSQQDFLQRLPLRQLTDPQLGAAPLNLASHLAPRDNPTDLGPKCYVGYGRWVETEGEGDCVTKLHFDMSDAVNILVDLQPGGDVAMRELLQQAQQQGMQQPQELQQQLSAFQQQRKRRQLGMAAAMVAVEEIGLWGDGQGASRARCGEHEPSKPG